MPIQVLLLGPPGAGKGTQARRLAERLGLVHISPGQIFRERLCSDPRVRELMSAGELVPSELTDRVVRERLEALSPQEGFVLDGYPRTAAEARFLRRTLTELHRRQPPPVAVWLDAPRDVLLARLRERGRADDSEPTVERRLHVFGAEAWPLWEALAGWTERVTVDAARPADEVTAAILDAVHASDLTARS